MSTLAAKKKKEEIDNLIREIELTGCNCDVMNNYPCEIHNLVRELRGKINVKIQ